MYTFPIVRHSASETSHELFCLLIRATSRRMWLERKLRVCRQNVMTISAMRYTASLLSERHDNTKPVALLLTKDVNWTITKHRCAVWEGVSVSCICQCTSNCTFWKAGTFVCKKKTGSEAIFILFDCVYSTQNTLMWANVLLTEKNTSSPIQANTECGLSSAPHDGSFSLIPSALCTWKSVHSRISCVFQTPACYVWCSSCCDCLFPVRRMWTWEGVAVTVTSQRSKPSTRTAVGKQAQAQALTGQSCHDRVAQTPVVWRSKHSLSFIRRCLARPACVASVI